MNNYGKKITITIEDYSDYFKCNTISTNRYSQYNPCENCSNNPKNNPNASGFCCCALPAMNNVVY